MCSVCIGTMTFHFIKVKTFDNNRTCGTYSRNQ